MCDEIFNYKIVLRLPKKPVQIGAGWLWRQEKSTFWISEGSYDRAERRKVPPKIGKCCRNCEISSSLCAPCGWWCLNVAVVL